MENDGLKYKVTRFARDNKIFLHSTVELLHKGIYLFIHGIIVASEASDLIFKIVNFHDVPPRSSSLYTGFSRTVWGRRRWRCRFREVDLTPPRWLGIS